jgi:Tol biopolymer transport system component
VFFSSRAGNADIWEVDIQSGGLIQLTKGPALDRNPAYSPSGSLIAYQSDDGGRMELWVMGHDGREKRQVTTMGVGGHFLMWLYDSDRIVFNSPSREGSRVLIASVSDGSFEEISIKGGSHMSKSPDERIFMDVTGHKTLWASPIGGGEIVKIFEFDDPDYRIDYPRWSPDGRNVMFDLVTPRGGDIWVIEGM